MSQALSYHCVEYIKLDVCAKFHDHWSNNNKVIMRTPMADSLKKADVKWGLFAN